MICHRSSLTRQSCHLQTDFDRVQLERVAAGAWRTLWTPSLNSDRESDIHYWNVWSVNKKVSQSSQSLIRYYWIFRTRTHVHLRNWTLKFNLNCCNLSIEPVVIFIKFARYVDWILLCKFCKFGEYICQISRDIKFSLGVYFFWRALYKASCARPG